MDQICTTGVSDRPAVAGNDPAKGVSGDVPAAAGGGCFDCNICLDFAVEPVVTLCGHVYCWPCIYEWLRHDTEADTSDGRSSTRRPCPVCKAALTPETLVPLYGRGGSRSEKPRPGPAIPRRPTVHRGAVEQQTAQGSDDRNRQHESMEPNPPTRPPRHAHAQHYASDARFDVFYPPPLGRGMNTIHSTAGGVPGGIAVAVLPWLFRGQVPPQGAYHLSPYHVAAVQNMNPRLRRRYMEVERSLHQIWFFLCVFVVLCLLLF